MGDVKYLSVAEFVSAGWLQEANRLFFHPHGLALEVTVPDEGGEPFLSGVWDYRDDPEGVVFGGLEEGERSRAVGVEAERWRHFTARAELFGRPHAHPDRIADDAADVQPLDWVYERGEKGDDS